MLRHAIHPLQPTQPTLIKLLIPRLQRRPLGLDIVHLSQPQDRHPGHARGDAIHEAAAYAAEVVRHGVAARDGGLHAELGEFFLAADVAEGGVFDGEVGGED